MINSKNVSLILASIGFLVLSITVSLYQHFSILKKINDQVRTVSCILGSGSWRRRALSDYVPRSKSNI